MAERIKPGDVYLFNHKHYTYLKHNFVLKSANSLADGHQFGSNGWIIFLLIIFTVLFVLPFSGLFVIREAILASSGTLTTAEITGTSTIATNPFAGGTVRYAFTVEDELFAAEQEVTGATLGRLQRGDQVQIEYISGWLGFSRLSGPDNSGLIAMLGSLVLCGGLWLLAYVFILRPDAKTREMMEESVLLKGVLLDYEKDTDKDKGKGKDPTATVFYRFETPQGETINHIERRVLDNAKRNTMLPVPGTPVAVLYQDRNNFRLL